MNADEYARHKKAYDEGLLEVLPHPETGWDQIPLPTYFLNSEGLRTDITNSAQTNADNTGRPQRLIVKGEIGGVEVSTQEIIEVRYNVRAAVLGHSRSIAGWVEP